MIDGNTLTNASGLGCVTYRSYLFVFRNDNMDVFGPITSSGLDSASWNNGLVSLNTAGGTSNSHHAIVGQDDIIYYCDGKYIGSFTEASGKTFAPTDATTWVSTTTAFAVDGRKIIVSAGQFLSPGNTITVLVDQAEQGAFDNSDVNGNLLASNGLGSEQGEFDRSSPGVGIKLRSPDGQLWHITVTNAGAILTTAL